MNKQIKMSSNNNFFNTINNIIVSFTGRTSVGKSSTINALIDHNIMYTNELKSTVYPSVLIHSNKINERHTQEKNKKANEVDITKIKEKFVNRVSVDLTKFCDSIGDVLKNTTIIDFPGFETDNVSEYDYVELFNGSLAKYNTLMFYITDFSNANEYEYVIKDIEFIASKCNNIIILFNKSDTRTNNKKHYQSLEFLEHIKKIITIKKKHNLTCLQISAKSTFGLKSIIGYIKQYRKKVLFHMCTKITEQVKHQQVPVCILSTHVKELVEKNKILSDGSKKLLSGLAVGGIIGIGGAILVGGILITALTGGLAGGPILGALSAFGPGGVAGGIASIAAITGGSGIVAGTIGGISTSLITGVAIDILTFNSLNIDKVQFVSKNHKQEIDEYIEQNGRCDISENKYPKQIGFPKNYYTSYEDHKYIKVDNKYFCISGTFKLSKILLAEKVVLTEIIFENN